MSDNTVTWLHLSDFHFTKDKKPYDTYSRNVILHNLLNDIESRVKGGGGLSLKPNFIIITGDVAFSGKEDDYLLAESFLDKLLAKTGLNKDRLFIVPGNHDIDQDKFSLPHFNALRNNREEALKLLLTDDDRRHIFRKFNTYEKFIKRYFGDLITLNCDNYFYTKTFQVSGKNVAILGLNSAWMCGSKEADNSHSLYLGEPSLNAALEETKDPHLKIAAFHHPLNEYQQEELQYLKENLPPCNYILTGHMHTTTIEETGGPGGKLFCITAGSCYESKKHSDAYNFVRLDYDKSEGVAYFRIRPNNKSHWIWDTITYKALAKTNGVYTWPLKEGPKPVMVETTTDGAPPLTHKFIHATPPTTNWAGREKELADLTQYFKNGLKVVSLEGWGGTGKSSLAMRWYEQFAVNGIRPDGVLWWSFYYNKSLEEFFNAALDYVSRGECRVNEVKGLEAKKDKTVAYLKEGSFVFFLDGMEDIQKSEATEHYGSLEDKTMRGFLELWASGEIPGCCLISTRYPLPDIEPWRNKSFKVESIDDLDPPDAQQLLEKAGITGEYEDYKKIHDGFGGHALSLTLLAQYLQKFEDGLAKNSSKIPFLKIDPKKNKAVRILNAYREKLDKPYIQFMQFLSCFLAPVGHEEFNEVFLMEVGGINKEMAELPKFNFNEMVAFLKDMHLIAMSDKNSYTAHPLVRQYFQDSLEEEDKKLIYSKLYNYMDEVVKRTVPLKPKSVKEMTPLFHQVAYGCRAGQHDRALNDVYEPKIKRKEEALLSHKLGAWAATLDVLRNFFPDGDYKGTPLVSKVGDQAFLINEAALSMDNLGRLEEAEGLSRKGIELVLLRDNHENTSIGYQNLASLLISSGNLNGALDAAKEALRHAEKAPRITQRTTSTLYIAYTKFMLGKRDEAAEGFHKANDQEIERNHRVKYLYSGRGIFYADFLLALGDTNKALDVTKENITLCVREGWVDFICHCHRSLASIYRKMCESGKARNNIEKAQEIAQKIDRLDLKLEVVLERGRIELAEEHYADAEKCLTDCRDRAVRFGYRLLEADARNGLAMVYKATDRQSEAKVEAEKALTIANETGYYWAKKDAEEFLGLPITPPPS